MCRPCCWTVLCQRCTGILCPPNQYEDIWKDIRYHTKDDMQCNMFTKPTYHNTLNTYCILTVSCRCTTGESAASTNTTLIMWRSRSWPSVGIAPTACCQACTPSVSTHLMSGFITGREMVPQAPTSSLRHLKGVGEGILFLCFFLLLLYLNWD